MERCAYNESEAVDENGNVVHRRNVSGLIVFIHNNFFQKKERFSEHIFSSFFMM